MMKNAKAQRTTSATGDAKALMRPHYPLDVIQLGMR
jgi:hypothetical protein